MTGMRAGPLDELHSLGVSFSTYADCWGAGMHRVCRGKGEMLEAEKPACKSRWLH